MALKTCPKCGNQYPDYLTKCPFCVAKEAEAAKAKKMDMKKLSKILLPILGVLIFAAVFIVIGHHFINRNKEPEYLEEMYEPPVFPYPPSYAPVESTPSVSEVSIEDAWSFIRRMYNLSLFEDDSFLIRNCSASLLKKLRDNYPYEGDGYDVSAFRSGYQDGYSEVHKLVTVYKEDNGWFMYQGIDMGWLFSRSVKLSYQDGRIIMDDLYEGVINESKPKEGSPLAMKRGVIPPAINMDPAISQKDFLSVLGFSETSEDDLEFHIVHNNEVYNDRTIQLMAIYTSYGGHAWYEVFSINLEKRTYAQIGNFGNVKFNASGFETFNSENVIIDEDTNFGVLTTQSWYDYEGNLLRSISDLSDIEDYWVDE